MTKATILAAKKPHKCRQCGGLAPYDVDEGGYKCTACGRLEVARHVLYEFIEANKNEILHDTLRLGTVKTRATWGIPKDVWSVVVRRWGIRKVWEVPGMSAVSGDGLPLLPAWQQSWPSEFKMKWLEIYKILAEIRKGSENNGSGRLISRNGANNKEQPILAERARRGEKPTGIERE